MHFTAESSGSSRAAYQVIPSAQVARLGWRVLSADLDIQEQADQVLAYKEVRDIRADRRAAQVCGCRHCQGAYRHTLVFYARLGLRPRPNEAVSTTGITRYIRRGAARR
jgi:hypothetical protein